MKKKLLKGLTVLGVSTILTFYSGAGAVQAYTGYALHPVVAGESLWKISNKYDVSIDEIVKTNNLSTTNINIGQELKIPITISDTAIEYTVKSGDVLWKIADKYKVSVKQIADLNKLDPYAQLRIGQKIYIPNTTENSQITHTVASGEVVWKIAQKYNVSAKDILKANNLSESSTIYIGQKLVIPSDIVADTPEPESPPVSKEPYVTYSEYIVQRGDIIWDLSIKYGIPQAELLKVNNLNMNSMLSVGQKLIIPKHHIPIIPTMGPKYGEYLDWWTQAQYVFPIGAKAKVTDFATGKSYNVIRSIGANHADCEPLTARDAEIMYEIWGNKWSWKERAAIVEFNGRKIAASVTNMPHNIETIKNNNFNGHFDIHFKNSTRHNNGLVTPDHQAQIKISAGIK